MKIYFNIIKTILICNIFCCFIASIYLWGGRNDFFGRYLFSLFYSYMMFGITGSIIWYLLYSLISKVIEKKEISHLLACGLSSILASPIFYIVVVGEVNAIIKSFWYVKFTIPTAAVCLIFYIYRYLKYETNKIL